MDNNETTKILCIHQSNASLSIFLSLREDVVCFTIEICFHNLSIALQFTKRSTKKSDN